MIPQHPLTPTRRQATVVDIVDSLGVGVVLGGDDPADTSKWVYASYLASYPPAVGDTVITLSHEGDHFVLGAPSWVGSGQLVGLSTTNSTVDAPSGTKTTVQTATATVVAGRCYLVHCYMFGVQVTNATSVTWFACDTSDGYLSTARFHQANSSTPANSASLASGTLLWLPAATGAYTVTTSAFVTTSAWRSTTDACRIAVVDVGP